MDSAIDSGRHPVNIGQLVMGIAFAGLVAIWAVVTGDVVEDEDIRWLMPAPWVLAGAVGLVAATVTSRRRNQPTFAQPAYAVEPEPAEAAEPAYDDLDAALAEAETAEASDTEPTTPIDNPEEDR